MKKEYRKETREDRSKIKEIGQYLDEKTGVMVRVFAGPEARPFRSVPTGYEV